jgi:hypothetical protein
MYLHPFFTSNTRMEWTVRFPRQLGTELLVTTEEEAGWAAELGGTLCAVEESVFLSLHGTLQETQKLLIVSVMRTKATELHNT